MPGTEIINSIFEKILYAFGWVCAFLIFLIQAIELWRIHITGHIPNPWGFTIVSIGLGAYIIYKYRNFLPEIQGYAQGRQGEIYVGRVLESLRPYGYTPINDVLCLSDNGKPFNIDHVLVGPTGIFVIETKTFSKKPGQKMTYKNQSLDHLYGAAALDEARRHAAHLGSLLRERVPSSHVWVYPILALPGWWVDNKSAIDPRNDNNEVIVVNPKQIGAYLKDWERKYSDEQIQKIVTAVSSYIFETQDKLDS